MTQINAKPVFSNFSIVLSIEALIRLSTQTSRIEKDEREKKIFILT